MPIADFKTYCAILDRARDGHYALPRLTSPHSRPRMQSCADSPRAKPDGIIQVSTGGARSLREAQSRTWRSAQSPSPNTCIAWPIVIRSTSHLNTDHCVKDKLDKFVLPLVEETEKRRAAGKPNLFTAHMFDGSTLPLKENLDIAASLLERFAKNDLVLEIEVGAVGGEEDDVKGEKGAKLYTTPEDTLAVARKLNPIGGRYVLAATFGNVHGVYKPGTVKLQPKILKECQDAVVKEFGENARFYFVFHGGSGSTQEEIHEAIDYGVIKMNVDTDMQYAFTRPIADHMFKNYDGVLEVDGEVGRKKDYDPRTYLGLAEAAMAQRVKQAVTDLRGNGKTMFKP